MDIKGKTIEVLVAAMNQNDHSLVKRMNIQTDAIVGNQCNKNSIEEFCYNGRNITYLNFCEKGVGLNRNNALMRASAQYCLFADDDMVYEDNYEEIIINAFNRIPDAEIIIFNLHDSNSIRYTIKETHRVHFYNFLRYGTARISVKLRSVRESGIYFNQCFGGGTEHSHGEDNIFLSDCIKKGLKVYAVPEYIATLTDDRKPTWNRSFNRKYLVDQGCLYRVISRRFWKLLCIQDAIRWRKLYNKNCISSYHIMIGKGE